MSLLSMSVNEPIYGECCKGLLEYSHLYADCINRGGVK